MGHQVNIAYALRCLGWCARLEGDFLKTRSLYSESLQRAYRIQDKMGMAECLIYAGLWKGQQGSPEKFVRLLGMAEGIASHIRKWIDRFVDNEIKNFSTTARTVLGDEAYQAAWEAGRRASLEEAVAYALNELQT